MDEGTPLDYVFQMLGAAVNGVLQVVTDFLNLIIETVPNPDPFPEIIANMPDQLTLDVGMALYWLDAFVGVQEANLVISLFVTLWVASLIFALIFKLIGMIKP